MPNKLHLFRASWTLVDQGVVSAGAFLVNVQIARNLPASEYGTFALLLGAFMALQLFNSSLLLYPMSIRLPVMEKDDKKALQATTVLLVLGLCIPLCAALAIGLVVLGRGDLALPAVIAFLCWQMQESLRRGLLSEFRHGTAIIGDATAYHGQVVAVAALTFSHELALPHVFEVMAVAYAVGALIQALQLRLSFNPIANLRQTATSFVSVGSWSLVNNLISTLRVQLLPWSLAAVSGPAAAAGFQAALNVVNLTNPILIGLQNVIPQTAAHAQHSGGNAEAWRASRTYVLMGLPPIVGYYGVVFLVPSLFLSLFYGAGSPYVSLTVPLQILAVAWVMGYVTDMTCSYLHGVNSARLALVINMLGAVAVAVLALPLITTLGLIGGCAALLGANFLRLLLSYHIQKRVTADEYVAA
jgi:O-antigen/teichoic acid export membrane protein